MNERAVLASFLETCQGLTKEDKHRLAHQYVTLVFPGQIEVSLAKSEVREIPGELRETARKTSERACQLAGFDDGRDATLEYDHVEYSYDEAGRAQIKFLDPDEEDADYRTILEDYLNCDAAGDAVWDVAQAIILHAYYRAATLENLVAPWKTAGLPLAGL